MAGTHRFLRDNAVLVAAFVLPAIVAVLFILATAIPKWTVPLPQHDLLLRVDSYQSPPPEVSVEFAVRDGRLEAVVRPVVKPDNPNLGMTYPQRWALLLFDHASMRVREIPLARELQGCQPVRSGDMAHPLELLAALLDPARGPEPAGRAF